MNRKATCFFWIFILMVHANVMAQQWTMTIGNKISLPDRTIRVPLDVDFSQIPGGVGSIQFEFRFDTPVLQFVGFDNVHSSVADINYVVLSPGRVFVAWQHSVNPTTTQNGKLLDLVFSYSSGESPVTFELGNLLITDATNISFPGTTTGGLVRELKQYTVTMLTMPPGVPAVLTGAGTYWEGDPVNISTTVPPGWTFFRWRALNEAGLLQESLFQPVNNFTMPNRDVTIRAEFIEEPDDPVEFTLVVVGTGTVSIGEDEFPAGTYNLRYERETVLPLLAAPGTGWQFEGWSGALTGSQVQQTLTLSEDETTVTATFKEIPPPSHILTLFIEGNGHVFADGVSYSEPENTIGFYTPTRIPLNAVDAPGWRFKQWAGNIPLSQQSNPNLNNYLVNGNRTLTAIFEPIPDSVTLTIHSIGSGQVLVDGESVINGLADTREVTVAYGTTLSLAAWPAANFAFDGWSGLITSADNEVSTGPLTDNAAVTATFIQTFPLSLRVNPEGIGATTEGGGHYRAGAEVVIAASPLEDYNFAGWTGAAADVALLDEPASLATGMTMPARAVELTANYTPGAPEEFTLTLLANPGDIGAALSQLPEGPYQQGQRVDIAASEVEGYIFSGWTSAGGGDTPFIDEPAAATTYLIMPAENLTLVANYSIYIPAKHTLTLQTDPPLGFIPIGGGDYEEGQTVNISTPASVGDYFFDYWEQDHPDPVLIADIGNWITTVTMPAADLTLTAIYSLSTPVPQYTLTIHIEGNGQVTTDGVSYTTRVTVDEGTEILLGAMAAEGWEFSAWSGDLVSTETGVAITMDADKEVTATFKEEEPPLPDTFLLDLLINGEGAVEIIDRGTFDRDTLLEFMASAGLALVAMPESGWSFTGWSGDLSGTDEASYLQMNDNKTVIANFIEDPITYTLTVHVAGIGEVLVNGTPYTDPLTVNPGTLLVLQPFPGDSWRFDGWSGDHFGDEDMLLLTMDDDKSLTANFSEIPPPAYTLTLHITGNGVVMVGGGFYEAGSHQIGPIEEGTPLPLQATPGEGWEFAGWSGDLAGQNPGMELLIDGHKQVTATFIEEEEEIPPPPVYTLSFIVQNQAGIRINDAVITLDATEYEEGEYQFTNREPGSYTYAVNRTGFIESTGTAVIVDADLEVVVIMLTDPARMDFLVLYPNPTRTVITVEANQPFNEMRVYNNLGQLMLSASFNYTLKYTSDVRILANGIYYLRITTEKDVRTGKFEVIH